MIDKINAPALKTDNIIPIRTNHGCKKSVAIESNLSVPVAAANVTFAFNNNNTTAIPILRTVFTNFYFMLFFPFFLFIFYNCLFFFLYRSYLYARSIKSLPSSYLFKILIIVFQVLN